MKFVLSHAAVLFLRSSCHHDEEILFSDYSADGRFLLGASERGGVNTIFRSASADLKKDWRLHLNLSEYLSAL